MASLTEPRTSVVRDFSTPAATGYLSSGGVFETYTGKMFLLFDPRPEHVDIWDIAHQLAMICRYNGACRYRYSVAEHCVHVHDEFVRAYKNFKDAPAQVRDQVALALLMHDAHEAYVGDLTRGLLSHPDVAAAFLPIADRIQSVIEEVYNVDSLPAALLEEYDDNVLVAEASQLIHSQGKAWNVPCTSDQPVRVCCWDPSQAKQQFLTRFFRYRPTPDSERTINCGAPVSSLSDGVAEVAMA